MSIIPVGNRKSQVNQGPFQNESILNSILFQKFGQGIGGLVDNKKQQQPIAPPPGPEGLQEAMDSGGLDHDGMAAQLEQQAPDMEMQNDQNIAPAGIGGSPASRFLGRDPDEDGMQADPNALWQGERQKIRSFIGNEFGMKLVSGDDGSFTVILSPPNNVPVQDPSGFMDALLQHIGGATVNEEDTPALSDAGGKLTLKYRPSGAGPQKIRPRGKGRR